MLELVPIGAACGFSSENFRGQGKKPQEYLMYFSDFFKVARVSLTQSAEIFAEKTCANPIGTCSYISQSAVSQQIQALERELGVTLLKREKRRFSLTPAGEHFYQKSLIITADFERLCRETKQIEHGNKFTLSIGYSKGYGGAEFQRAAAEFTAKYPDVPVEMKNGNHEDLYKNLSSQDTARVFSANFADDCVKIP